MISLPSGLTHLSLLRLELETALYKSAVIFIECTKGDGSSLISRMGAISNVFNGLGIVSGASREAVAKRPLDYPLHFESDPNPLHQIVFAIKLDQESRDRMLNPQAYESMGMGIEAVQSLEKGQDDGLFEKAMVMATNEWLDANYVVSSKTNLRIIQEKAAGRPDLILHSSRSGTMSIHYLDNPRTYCVTMHFLRAMSMAGIDQAKVEDNACGFIWMQSQDTLPAGGICEAEAGMIEFEAEFQHAQEPTLRRALVQEAATIREMGRSLIYTGD